MALPALVAGADCGPSNPLQGLTKRFDQDRGLQQDYFGAGSSFSSSSRQAFRTQEGGPLLPDQEAAQFFASSSSQASLSHFASNPYDVSTLRAALLAPQPGITAQAPPPAVAASWAADFMQSAMTSPQPQIAREELQLPSAKQNIHISGPAAPPFVSQWNTNVPTFRPVHTPGLALQAAVMQQQQALLQSNQISWDEEFKLQELAMASQTTAVEPRSEVVSKPQSSFEGDELARTAGMLLENIQHEQNPKFKNSQFVSLMQQLRDGAVVVEGNQMVENTGGVRVNSSKVDVKGKGRAIEPIELTQPLRVTSLPAGSSLNIASPLTQVEQNQSTQQQEDENDAYFRQVNEDYVNYWQNANAGPVTQMARMNTGWDKLQEDWDQFEATSTGIRAINPYQFQEGNPYLLGDPSTTRHHAMHAQEQLSFLESVLELEAAVQQDMNSAMAWFELGVKQQENEREQKALQALQRAVDIDPSHLPSWLALAISHTNDNNRLGTYNAIREWVDRNEDAKSVIAGYYAENPLSPAASMVERFTHLINCLIAMVRSDASGEVDADTQIALAVLLNTNEDYEKAQDCFRTALAVRPDDWLLYNRVGATMANSGHAEEALQYYYRALELNPGYIRARFNLGISCINLRRYEEAAQHILDALVLQDNDGIKDAKGFNDKRGVTSAALWDSLKTTCLHLQRVDLASLCDRQDLEAFRLNFQISS
ncbi:TPR-like protein [Pluteus cervinus]|uniref:TPR-like protein n=1 Tax=Pluteus cervinus TaxID=181527 RepID=A0ACD3B8F8_9AGAR|nr:TPR-like protein [Pluteus cervinus]